MAQAAALISPKFYAFDPSTGDPLASGKVYAYEPGTSTPKSTYTDENADTENAHPVILNAAGYAPIFLAGEYKIVLHDADDNEVWSADPVTSSTQLAQQWIQEQPATQVDADEFSVEGNQTAIFSAGRAVKLEDDSDLYGHVTSAVYAGGVTTVTVSGLSSGLTASLDTVWIGLCTPDSLPILSSLKVDSASGSQTLSEALDDRVIHRDSIADMEAMDTSLLAAGVHINVRGTIFRWDGSDFVATGPVSLLAAGAALDGSDDSAAFATAAGYAIGEILIPSEQVTFGSDVDALGNLVRGQNTTVTGTIDNHAGLKGITVQGFRQDMVADQLPELVTNSPKVMYRISEDRYFVMTRKPGMRNHGVIFEIIRGITTTTNSLGGNAEFFRIGWVYNNTGIYFYRKTPDVESGTWESYTVPASYLLHDTDNEQRAAAIRRTSVDGAYSEFTVSVRPGQKVNVAFLGTSGSSDAEISVDGTLVKTVVTSDAEGRVWPVEIDVPPGNHTIRVTRPAGSGWLYLFGLDFASITDVRPNQNMDEWAAYRNPDMILYVQNQGAHDYALYDADADLWGGSFHGGETLQVGNVVLDGEASTFPGFSDGALFCRGDIYLRQRTVIDWTNAGSGRVETESLTVFRDGQVEIATSFRCMDGAQNFARFYTAMHGCHIDFDRMILPYQQALPTVDGENLLTGHESKIILRHAASDSLSVTEFNTYFDHGGEYGGGRVARAAGQYNKIYYGPVVNGIKTIDKLASIMRRTFR